MTATAPPAPSPEARTRGPQPYDFRQPRLLSQDRLRTLHTIHEAFGRQLAVHLSAQLRTLVELSVASIEQRTYADVVAASTAPTAFFSGDAAETATAFPKNANVAMTTALAGIGPAATRITLVADPGAGTNRHEIRARGGFGELDVTISNNPLPDNPKTSAMAALGLVRAIEQRVAPIAI